LLIKYIKSVLWRVAKCLSYIEEARCLKVYAMDTLSSKRNNFLTYTKTKGVSTNSDPYNLGKQVTSFAFQLRPISFKEIKARKGE